MLQLAAFPLRQVQDFDLTNNWIYRQTKWIKFPDDPIQSLMLELRVTSLAFAEPGEYLFVLTFDGLLITESRMSIKKVRLQ